MTAAVFFLAFAPLQAMAQAAGAQGAMQAAPANFQKLEDMLRAAYQTNPGLLAAREQLHGTHELLPQAQAGWKPTAGAQASVTNAHLVGDNFGGGGTTSKALSLNINQPLYRGGRTVAATDSADNKIMAQAALLNDAEQQLMVQVATAYMDVLRDDALLNLAQENRTLIARQLDAARARFRAGDATSTDVAQAEARLAAINARITQAEGAALNSAATYASLTGVQPGVLGYPVIAFRFPRTLADAVAQARQNNPSVVAGGYLQHAAQADIDTVFGELLPSLSLGLSFNKQYDPQPGLVDSSFDRTLALTASIPLYEAGGTRSRVRQAKHDANRRYLDLLETGRNVERDTVAGWQAIATASADITSRGAQVRAETAARDGVHQETALGTRTILDELDADAELLNAQTALVESRRDIVVAQFTLARTLGMLTPQTLGFGQIAEDHQAHLRQVEGKILGMDVQLEHAAY